MTHLCRQICPPKNTLPPDRIGSRSIIRMRTTSDPPEMEAQLPLSMYTARAIHGCHNLLTINPKEHTLNPEIIMKNTVPYGPKNPNILNLHMLMSKIEAQKS